MIIGSGNPAIMFQQSTTGSVERHLLIEHCHIIPLFQKPEVGGDEPKEGLLILGEYARRKALPP
jgi:hypothetical protein